MLPWRTGWPKPPLWFRPSPVPPLETDSQRRVFEHAFTDAGIDAEEPDHHRHRSRFPLDKASREAGYRAVFNADPNVGGRYSALTAFGLVPSGLAGVDIQAFLDEAEEAAEILNDDAAENIGLALGAALGGTSPLRNKIVIAEDGSGIVGFADWAEQLIAESTGKLGTGVLPVVAGPDVPGGQLRRRRTSWWCAWWPRMPTSNSVRTKWPSPAACATQMMVWEFATAVAGRLLGINPFDQPDVEAAKVAARGLLDAQPEPTPAAFVDGAIEVRGGDWLGDAATAAGSRQRTAGHPRRPDSYLSVQAYFDRLAFAELEGVRDELAAASGRPVTFGWGPRFLHSTGQFHKGGPAIGVFLQVTAAPTEDLAIPDRPFTFGELISAQAAGDAQVLAEHGRPVLRLHLTNRAAGVAQLQDIVAALCRPVASATES